jgi:hypothetical protein
MVELFHRVFHNTSTHHHGAASLAKLRWPQDYQPGCTAVSLRNQWATQFFSKECDVYGRWSWLTVAGRGTKKITFISAYRVCDGALEAAITSRTVRAQQEWMYTDRGYSTMVNLRNHFVTNISLWQEEVPRKSRSSRRIEYAMEHWKQQSRHEHYVLNKNGCTLTGATLRLTYGTSL